MYLQNKPTSFFYKTNGSESSQIVEFDVVRNHVLHLSSMLSQRDC